MPLDFQGYPFFLTPNQQGGWVATIRDLLDLDLHAQGDTPEQAVAALRIAFSNVEQDLQAQGREIPPPPEIVL